MSERTKSRPKSTSSAASSLMQDVPGAFSPPTRNDVESDNEGETGEEELAYRTLPQLVFARKAEYVRPKQVRVKIGTWNVAAAKGAEKDVGGWFVGARGVSTELGGLNISDPAPVGEGEVEDAGEQEAHFQQGGSTLPRGDAAVLPHDDQVGIYVLGLQEVVDVTSPAEALRPYADSAVTTRWKESVGSALPVGYQLIAEQQLVGLLLLIYAHPDVAPDIKSVSTTSVGTGLMGYMGNKGAVTARMVIGESTRLVFVNCHLAAGADKTALERRNWDAQQIVSRARFEPIPDAVDLKQTTGEQIGEEDFAFWCGDLNYRMEGIPGDDVRRLLMLHTRNEYDLSQPSGHKIDNELSEATESVKQRISADDSDDLSTQRQSIDSHDSVDSSTRIMMVDDVQASEDPMSLQTTLSSLLPHDELQQQMKARKAFHNGWQEGPITFLPTYKYDIGTVGVFDSSEKKRAPSWCDRILYRTRRDKLAYEAKVREEVDAKKKDEEMTANGTVQAASDEEVLYDYDPETDGADANGYDEYDEYDEHDEDAVLTKEGFDDAISLEYYTAHQRVISSDHKPLNASFLLKYDAVIPDLKAKIHAEVAKELDKQENEGRPNVVVVVDGHHESTESAEGNVPGRFEGVWFGDVRWMQTKHRTLTVANTSRVPATFSFIERPTEDPNKSGLAPNWLSIRVNGQAVTSDSEKSESNALEPGETAIVELELRVTSVDDVNILNQASHELEDILVLRVDNGRDHFIPVRGHWLESVLARSIDKLIRIPEGGIRKLQRQKPHGENKVKSADSTATNAGDLSEDGKSSYDENEPTTRSGEPTDEPVYFSAPRELFRLTEAVEELSTRVVAEWEMTNALPSPIGYAAAAQTSPWDDYPAWPFDSESWTEQDSLEWHTALSDACNALDEDGSIELALPPELSKIQRLHVLSSLLLTLLQNIPDGIITEDLWVQVDRYLSESEKQKRKRSNDEQRTAIQEILSQSPSHSISFILITSMLERMIQERLASETTPSFAPGHNRTPSRDTIEMPLSPAKRAGGALKRMVAGRSSTATVNPPEKKRELAIKALAKIFGPAVARAPASVGEKARIALEKKQADLVDMFLRRDEPS